jgi:hypothetical protein
VSTRTRRVVLAFSTALLVGTLFAVAALAVDDTSFRMVRSESARANDCLEGARATVNIRTVGVNQVMRVSASDMPKNTLFTLFVIQQPNAPFGIVWYQGDLKTDVYGEGQVTVRGIFSEETFTFAPGSVPAPQVDDQDAATNPAFDPVHPFHLGLWFASSAGAERAGCSDAVTPFDGDHEAGIQALSTRTFPNLEGPLSRIN